jgi:hypothetical protein
MTLAERIKIEIDASDPEGAKKDERALASLRKYGSIAQAAVASGWSVSSLYRRGVVDRYCDWLASRPSQDPPSPERR